MTARFFDGLLARAAGQLGPARVRPQRAPAWAPAAGDAGNVLQTGGPGDERSASAWREGSDTARPAGTESAPVAPASAVRPHARSALQALQGPSTSNSEQVGRDAEPATPHPQDPLRRQTALQPAPPQALRSRELIDTPSDGPPPPLQASVAPATQRASEAAGTPAGIAPMAIARAHAAAASRPIPALPARAAQTQPEATVVHVSIGRVELFAPTPAPAVRAPRSAPRSGSVPLADYLRGKGR